MRTKQFTKKLNKSPIPAKEPKKRIKKLNGKASGKKLEKSNEKTIGKKLEKIDPELFEYLKQNDKKLLDCEETDLEPSESENEQGSDDENASEGDLQVDQSGSDDEGSDLDAEAEEEEEEDDDEESDDVSESSDDEKVHQPPESLEVASDESDFEKDDDDDDEQTVTRQSGKITISMVNTWENELQSNKRNIKSLATVVKAFHACLVRISGESDPKSQNGFRVDGSTVFNAVLRLCVTEVYPFISKVLNLPPSSVTKKIVMKSKKWSQAKNTIRNYIVDIIKMIKNISSEDVVRVLLKHFHQLTPLAACLPTVAKPILRQLISVWGTHSDDTVRVIAFLCILRFATTDLDTNLHAVLKKMYFSYVSNSKFISQNSILTVNFMRKSLTEMFCLNDSISYSHAFLFIRQLAIHLRSAVVTKKKDSVQAVYNWQFVSSLRLWVDVLCKMHDKNQLNQGRPQAVAKIIIGCIKLIPTAQYFPLRFHCIRMLNKLSKETGIFIPTLPFIVEIFSTSNLSSQHKKMSMKPMDFTYILRLSKAQMQENAFKDAVIENIYDLVLEYVAAESHRISFPETVLLLQIQTKQFLKDCKNMNYSRKIKPLLEKIEETSKTINTERSKCGIALSDEKGLAAWESNMKLKTNSLKEFHKTWVKVNEQKIKQKQIDKINLDDYELPVLTKLPGKKTVDQKKKPKNENGRVELFSSDEEDDDNDDIKFGLGDVSEGEQEPEQPKKSNKSNKKKPNKAEKRKSNGKETGPSEKKKPKRDVTTTESEEVADGGDIVEDLDLSKF